ncbi:SoxR reducing system RseC family protein [Peptostreptococcus stomatis]|uniref:SoxR reducing system RseC family protein n=1 Tax=Peptostreptococcus stomatis TaxID=341694 RepID=UPI003F9F16E2
MDQRGRIVEIIDERTAMMKMQRNSACASCGKCIGSSSSESQEIIVEVDNTIGAKLGDEVEVSMDQIDVMKALGILYGIPLLGLLIGSVGSYYILKSLGVTSMLEVLSALVGFAFTGLAYLLIRSREGKFRASRKYMPTITRVVIDLNTCSLDGSCEGM